MWSGSKIKERLTIQTRACHTYLFASKGKKIYISNPNFNESSFFLP